MNNSKTLVPGKPYLVQENDKCYLEVNQFRVEVKHVRDLALLISPVELMTGPNNRIPRPKDSLPQLWTPESKMLRCEKHNPDGRRCVKVFGHNPKHCFRGAVSEQAEPRPEKSDPVSVQTGEKLTGKAKSGHYGGKAAKRSKEKVSSRKLGPGDRVRTLTMAEAQAGVSPITRAACRQCNRKPVKGKKLCRKHLEAARARMANATASRWPVLLNETKKS